MKHGLTLELGGTSAASCFDRLSMRAFFHLVLSLSKGEVGTASRLDTEVGSTAAVFGAA